MVWDTSRSWFTPHPDGVKVIESPSLNIDLEHSKHYKPPNTESPLFTSKTAPCQLFTNKQQNWEEQQANELPTNAFQEQRHWQLVTISTGGLNFWSAQHSPSLQHRDHAWRSQQNYQHEHFFQWTSAPQQALLTDWLIHHVHLNTMLCTITQW